MIVQILRLPNIGLDELRDFTIAAFKRISCYLQDPVCCVIAAKAEESVALQIRDQTIDHVVVANITKLHIAVLFV